ncbi:MAG: 50S ribosomal protein L17 [Chloroflexi bacterium]|jgi:large subunit ribosomal protein L17|nr:50S ribosomal protein L17 [Chloroflexota bacterium]MBT7080855.1 50S ribosomal protein L17 [Chloroflexota bacterium]MBT7289393.1 50S ribosomal protein L17 [Chloroflexota bacterium]
MRHKVAGRRLGRSSAHRSALFKNLITDLLRSEKIVTTEAKAKEIKGLAEKVITMGKDGSLAARRRAITRLTDMDVVDKVFSDIASRYIDREGGYTRILRLGPRQGDGAFMVQLELV